MSLRDAQTVGQKQDRMPATTAPPQEVRDQTRDYAHPQCVVCGQVHEAGLGLRFKPQDDGSVEACFNCKDIYQGYEGILHGGIAAALFDGAMTS